ncbi:hypothetical protein CBR_g20998 [Chara braunii]|uniref:Uncharacterized protein n=1 Tax=Chara braunii TaxID=69332 RepID=A0A388L0J0_CHABU|nr:hypothetical protein CBR_g20998 [Chara braunii]|eukprot:GBG75752.1 hypothetical protein CBR_g20998 [Chara braunii]
MAKLKEVCQCSWCSHFRLRFPGRGLASVPLRKLLRLLTFSRGTKVKIDDGKYSKGGRYDSAPSHKGMGRDDDDVRTAGISTAVMTGTTGNTPVARTWANTTKEVVASRSNGPQSDSLSQVWTGQSVLMSPGGCGPVPPTPPAFYGHPFASYTGGESGAQRSYASDGSYVALAEGEGGKYERILPCCGCGIGWTLFLLGFLVPVLWYVGGFLYLIFPGGLDRRERPGLAATAVAALVNLVFALIAFLILWVNDALSVGFHLRVRNRGSMGSGARLRNLFLACGRTDIIRNRGSYGKWCAPARPLPGLRKNWHHPQPRNYGKWLDQVGEQVVLLRASGLWVSVCFDKIVPLHGIDIRIESIVFCIGLPVGGVVPLLSVLCSNHNEAGVLTLGLRGSADAV